MAKADIWMPIYLGDYLRDTMHLSTEEHGAYFLILMELWNKGGKIPAKSLEIVARRPGNWRGIWENLQVFFRVENGWVSQKRLSSELERWKAFRLAKQAAGAKGGRPKKPTGKPTGLANNNLQGKPSPSPSPSPLKPPADPPKPPGGIEVPKEILPNWKEWEQTRKKKAGDRQFKKLMKLAGGDLNMANQILEQSIENQWIGLFEMKKGGQSGPGRPRTFQEIDDDNRAKALKRDQDIIDAWRRSSQGGSNTDGDKIPTPIERERPVRKQSGGTV